MALRRVKRPPQIAPQVMLTSMIDMFTILLVFLLISHTTIDLSPSDKLQIPLSTAEELPEMAIKIMVTKQDISLDDKILVPVANGRVHRGFKNGLTITPLYDALQQHVARKQEIMKNNPEVFERFKEKVLIVADKETPAALLDEIFYTVAQRDFGRFHLVVMKKPQANAASAVPAS